MSSNELRQRSGKATPKEDQSKSPADAAPAQDDSSFTPLEIARLFFGLLLMSGALSYLMTNGESFVFLQNLPWWTKPSQVLQHQKGPVRLTLDELRHYDGTDPDRPIYLAVNRTIYDVSASPHVYGAGGSYSVLTGKDASRAFITGCMDTDLIPDLRGVEEMYVPLWLSKNPEPEEFEALNPEAAMKKAEEAGGPAAAAAKMLKGETSAGILEKLRERVGPETVAILQNEAYEAAHEECRAVIDNWRKMFDGSSGKNYFEVGRVVGKDGKELRSEDLGPQPKLCKMARDKRPKMDKTLARAQDLRGKKVADS